MRSILRVAFGLAASISGAPAFAAAPASTYHCDGARSFKVEFAASSAKVNFEGAGFILQRRTSSIGQKYSSARATLILDGDFAAFVSRHETGLSGCNRATQSARL